MARTFQQGKHFRRSKAGKLFVAGKKTMQADKLVSKAGAMKYIQTTFLKHNARIRKSGSSFGAHVTPKSWTEKSSILKDLKAYVKMKSWVHEPSGIVAGRARAKDIAKSAGTYAIKVGKKLIRHDPTSMR